MDSLNKLIDNLDVETLYLLLKRADDKFNHHLKDFLIELSPYTSRINIYKREIGCWQIQIKFEETIYLELYHSITGKSVKIPFSNKDEIIQAIQSTDWNDRLESLFLYYTEQI